MGQYHRPVNLDRLEQLPPRSFGDSSKLLEFGCSSYGTLTALATLLTATARHQGPWAGERVTVTGDYGDKGRFVPPQLAEYCLYNALRWSESPQDRPEEVCEAPVYRLVEPDEITTEHQAQQVQTDPPFGEREHDNLLAGLAQRHFDQPEDLFEAFNAGLTDRLDHSVSDCLTTLRMAGAESSLCWNPVEAATLLIDPDTGRAYAMTAVFGRSHAGKVPLPRTLVFPAGGAEVIEFFDVDQKAKP